MKKVLGLSLAFLMLFGTGVFADSSDALTLDDAINQAITNSQQLKVDDLGIQNAQKVYDKVKDDSDNIYMTTVENAKWNVADAFKDPGYVSAQRKAKELTPEQKESEWNVDIKSKDLDSATIRMDVYSAYYSLIKAQEDTKVKSEEADVSVKEFLDVQSKYKKGLVSRNDYTLAQIAKKNAAIQFKLAQRAEKRLQAQFYKKMNAGYQPDVKDLVKSLEYTDLSDVSVEDCIINALKKRIEIFKGDENVRLKQLEYDIIDKYYDDDDTAYQDASNNLEEAELAFNTTKTDIEFEIRMAYINLQNMLDTIEINKEEVQKSQLSYSVVQTKKGLGMATVLEVDKAKLSLDEANQALDNSIVDYIIAKAQFEAAQGIGPAAPAASVQK